MSSMLSWQQRQQIYVLQGVQNHRDELDGARKHGGSPRVSASKAQRAGFGVPRNIVYKPERANTCALHVYEKHIPFDSWLSSEGQLALQSQLTPRRCVACSLFHKFCQLSTPHLSGQPLFYSNEHLNKRSSHFICLVPLLGIALTWDMLLAGLHQRW